MHANVLSTLKLSLKLTGGRSLTYSRRARCKNKNSKRINVSSSNVKYLVLDSYRHILRATKYLTSIP